jgi:hypothetical protein
MGFFETIRYTLIKKDKNIEIRQYDVFLLASTKTMSNKQFDSGFMNVFNYISGENHKDEKISMTTPVVSYEEEEQLITGFYVPAKYDKSTVPKPTNEHVFIQENEAAIYAVIRFSGGWHEKNFKKAELKLRDYIDLNHYQIISGRIIFRYQPPFIPGFLRRNEIAFKIKYN